MINDDFRYVRIPYIFAGDAPSRPIAHPKKAFIRIPEPSNVN